MADPARRKSIGATEFQPATIRSRLSLQYGSLAGKQRIRGSIPWRARGTGQFRVSLQGGCRQLLEDHEATEKDQLAD